MAFKKEYILEKPEFFCIIRLNCEDRRASTKNLTNKNETVPR